MQAKLLGYKVMKGVSKKTNKPYDGVLLHIAHPEPGIVGCSSTQLFVDNSIFAPNTPLEVDTVYEFTYEVSFNGFNRLTRVEQC